MQKSKMTNTMRKTIHRSSPRQKKLAGSKFLQGGTFLTICDSQLVYKACGTGHFSATVTCILQTEWSGENTSTGKLVELE